MLDVANFLQEQSKTMHPSFLWLIVGTSLCLVELVIPTALIAVFLGLATEFPTSRTLTMRSVDLWRSVAK
jgi:membrane protein implicated in regulation of membrane protease activity